jgi:hypothetical protein
LVDLVCVVELSVFWGGVSGVGWRRGFGFGFLLWWLLSSCGVIGGEIEGDLLFRVLLFFLVFLCAI